MIKLDGFITFDENEEYIILDVCKIITKEIIIISVY